jgi:predicted RNase H-like HicB family nuclease
MSTKVVKSNVQDGPQKLTINYRKREVSALLQIFLIKDGTWHVAYVPSLNISGYGKTEAGAYKMIKEVFEDYFVSIIKLDKEQISRELSKYGWERNAGFKKHYENKSYVDKFGVLNNFNLPKETPIKESKIEFA